MPGGLFCAISNPLTDGTWTYTWEKGRQLAGMSKPGTTASFKYNENGLRIQKVATSTGTTNYTLHGKNIVHMTRDKGEEHDTLHFFYDASNKPAIVEYNGTKYAYVHNLQGDIVAILDSNGTAVVQYKYDAWGKPFEPTGSMKDSLGKLNPFRYRGYVYDEETGLYYLRSRYYVSTWCRMVNADCQLNSSMMGKNTFAYCKNMPICCIDPNGRRTYIINGIGNDQKNGPPAYAEELAHKIQQAGETNVSAIGVYHGQTGIGGTIKGVAQVALEMLNIDIYSDDVYNFIQADLAQNPLGEGEKLILIGYSGGGQIALNVMEDLDGIVDHVILIGTPVAEMWDASEDVTLIYSNSDILSWNIGFGLKFHNLGDEAHDEYFNEQNIDSVVDIIMNTIQ